MHQTAFPTLPSLPARDLSHEGMIGAQRLATREAEAARGLDQDDAALLPLVLCLARIAARAHVQEML